MKLPKLPTPKALQTRGDRTEDSRGRLVTVLPGGCGPVTFGGCQRSSKWHGSGQAKEPPQHRGAVGAVGVGGVELQHEGWAWCETTCFVQILPSASLADLAGERESYVESKELAEEHVAGEHADAQVSEGVGTLQLAKKRSTHIHPVYPSWD